MKTPRAFGIQTHRNEARLPGLVFVLLLAVLLLAVLLASTGLVSSAFALSDPQSEGFEELIVELRAGQESSLTETAFLHQGRIWVPALPVLDLVEIDAIVDTMYVLNATLQPNQTLLNLDPTANIVRRGKTFRTLKSHELFVYDGRLFASAAVLGWLLDVDVYEDISELTVTFDPIENLPLGQRLRRERMRRLSAQKGVQPDIVFPAETEVWNGATLDWAFSSPGLETFEATSYNLAFGGAALGGGIDLRYRGRVDGQGPQDFDGSWQGVWPEQTWMRQLTVGRAQTTGPHPHPITGIALGNSPYLRSSEFGRTVLRGQLDPGWEVEVYRSGRLIAWDRVDERGSWEFAVPLDYGQNPVEIRSYGPHGEVRISERAVRVDADRLPAGRFEYGLSAGSCDERNCQSSMNLDLRYGLSERLTVRGGYEGYRRDSGAELHHPYLAFASSPVQLLRLSAERVHDAWWRGLVSLEPTSDFRATFEHFAFDAGTPTPLVASSDETHRSIASLFFRPLKNHRGLFLTFDGQQRRYFNFTTTRTSWGFNSSVQGIRTGVQWNEEWDEDFGRTNRFNSISYQLSTVLRGRGSALLHGIQLRLAGELETTSGRRDWIQALVGRRLFHSARIEVGAGWTRDRARPQFSIGITATGQHAYSTAQFTRDASGRNTGYLSSEGSLLYNSGSNRVESYPYRSLGRGGLSGTVFLDKNGNGVLDRGEAGIPGVRLVAGDEVVETDTYGRYSVWNLAPFEATDIQVQRASLKNPLWIPVFELAQAPVSPNGFRRVDLPLVEGIELQGLAFIRHGEAVYPTASVPLSLRQVPGKHHYETRSFHDGEFYILGVVPGTYELEIDASWLKARGLVRPPDAPTTITVPQGVGTMNLRIELSRPDQDRLSLG